MKILLGVLAVAVLAIGLGPVVPGQAASQRVGWSGLGSARLGEPLAASAKRLRRPVTTACGQQVVSVGSVILDDRGDKAGWLNGIHTAARGVTGPLGVRVGMSDSALRAALGRRSAAFTARGRRGRLLAGPKGRTLWALEASARASGVSEFGVAVGKRAALTAARTGPCTPKQPAPTNPAGPAEPAPAPDPGTTPTTTTSTPPPEPPVCPATLPSVGPYMRSACNDSTGNQVRYTCHPDWLDTNHDPADGCEAEKDGLQAMWFHQWSAGALADRVTGTFNMDGYAASNLELTTTDSGFHQGPSPIVIDVPPNCGSNPTVGCPDGHPQDPPPKLDLDITTHPGDTARSVIAPAGTSHPTGSTFTGAGTGFDRGDGTARFRLKTEAPIPITYAGAACLLSIDTIPGTRPDIQLTAQLQRVIDSTSGQGGNGPPQMSNLAVTGLESADYVLGGGFACGILSFPPGVAINVIIPALDDWYRAATRFCGTAGPYWWEPCPASVQVGW